MKNQDQIKLASEITDNLLKYIISKNMKIKDCLIESIDIQHFTDSTAIVVKFSAPNDIDFPAVSFVCRSTHYYN